MLGDVNSQPWLARILSHAGGIEIRHVQYALLAAELRSFAKAAEAVGIKNATLSRHITYLEQRFGVQLFARSTRGVVPTEAGHAFLDSARRVLGELEGLQEKTRAVARGTTGSLGIGFVTSITAGNLRSSLIAFRDSYSNIPVRCVEEERHLLLCRLNTGSLDLLIISGSVPFSGIERLGLWSERMIVALPAKHPLATHETVLWPELQGETFLAPKTTADDIDAMVRARLSRVGVPPSIVMTELSRETVLAMVSAEQGITLVSAGSAGLRLDNVVMRELYDATGPHNLDFSAYWRPDNRNAALRTFIDFLRARYSLALPSG